MNTTRAIAAAIGALAVVASGALATSALTAADGATPTVVHRAEYTEPASAPPADGSYLGYVRMTGRHDGSVAVDFVGRAGGRISNRRAEQHVAAGALTKVDVFDRIARPFRITIAHGVIVAVESADDILEPHEPAAVRLVGSVALTIGADGKVSLTIDGRAYETAEATVLDDLIAGLERR